MWRRPSGSSPVQDHLKQLCFPLDPLACTAIVPQESRSFRSNAASRRKHAGCKPSLQVVSSVSSLLSMTINDRCRCGAPIRLHSRPPSPSAPHAPPATAVAPAPLPSDFCSVQTRPEQLQEMVSARGVAYFALLVSLASAVVCVVGLAGLQVSGKGKGEAGRGREEMGKETPPDFWLIGTGCCQLHSSGLSAAPPLPTKQCCALTCPVPPAPGAPIIAERVPG